MGTRSSWLRKHTSLDTGRDGSSSKRRMFEAQNFPSMCFEMWSFRLVFVLEHTLFSHREERSTDGAGGLSLVVGLIFLFIKLLFSFVIFSTYLLLSPTTLWNGSLSPYGVTHFRVFTFILCFFSPHLLTTGNYSDNLCCINVQDKSSC
jgi:hypothetical protein